MAEAWHNFKFGLFFGCGLIAAWGFVHLILWLLNMLFGGHGAGAHLSF